MVVTIDSETKSLSYQALALWLWMATGIGCFSYLHGPKKNILGTPQRRLVTQCLGRMPEEMSARRSMNYAR
jgi:hypothetical protein